MMTINRRYYPGGTVTGDSYMQAFSAGLMHDSRYMLSIDDIAPLDAPVWLNSGRTVGVEMDDELHIIQCITLRGL